MALYIGFMSGWLWAFLVAIKDMFLDLLCQAWIDVSGLFRRKKFDNKFPGFDKDHEDFS